MSGWVDAWTPAPSEYAVAARKRRGRRRGEFARPTQSAPRGQRRGHSYLGTSNAPDSLLIWTRAMNKVAVHDAFVPRLPGPRARPSRAVSAGAGAMWIDLYDAVTTRAGRYVQGGGCTTVGVAGLVQSGGFGSFSKGFGTAAADFRSGDRHRGRPGADRQPAPTDLFWALKGGGGGSFGVVTKVTLQTHALPEFFGFAGGTISARSEVRVPRTDRPLLWILPGPTL